MLGGQGEAGGQGTACPHNPRGRREVLRREQMHMAAYTGAEAVRQAQEFPQERNQIHPPRHQRRRAAVIERHCVAFPKMINDTGGNGFLSDSQMHFAGDLTFFPQIAYRLFEAPAPQHLPVKRPQIRFHRFSSLHFSQ